MRRKLVQHGHSTLITSVPAKWVKKNNLKKGDEVDIFEEGNKLVVSAPEKEQPSKELRLSYQDKFLKRYINLAYKKGYDVLVIKYDDPRIIGLIYEELEELLGFEIVNQGKSSVTIRNYSKISSDEFEQAFNRLFFVILTMLDDLSSTTFSDSKKENIISLEKTSNKLAHYCQRALNSMFIDNFDLTTKYVFVDLLEQIADNVRDIAKQSKKIKDTNEEIKAIDLLMHSIYSAYFASSKRKINEVKRKRVHIIKVLKERLRKKEMPLLYHNLLSIAEKAKHLEIMIMPQEEHG